MRAVGERLQARARELGLADAEVARRLGLAQGRYSHYVNGTREPDLDTFVRICRVLSTTPNQMLGVEPVTEAGTGARMDSLLDGMDPDRIELALALVTTVAAHRTRGQRAAPETPEGKASALLKAKRTAVGTTKPSVSRDSSRDKSRKASK